jgi:hypothetical protein
VRTVRELSLFGAVGPSSECVKYHDYSNESVSDIGEHPMKRLLTTVLGIVLAQPSYGIDPNPAKLRPTVEQLEQIKDCTQKLGDPDYRVRESATKELQKLGAAGFTQLQETLQTTDDPEVRNRCERLLPAIEQAHFQLRLAAFLADEKNEFTHDLPMWASFREVAGDTPSAKKLYQKMLENSENRELLNSTALPDAEYSKRLLVRTTLLFRRRNPGLNTVIVVNNRVVREESTAIPVTLADLGALLLVESKRKVIDQKISPQVYSLILMLGQQPSFPAAENEPIRKILVAWMDSRTDALDLQMNLTLFRSLKLPSEVLARSVEKLLKSPNAATYDRMNALGLLASTGNRNHLPVLEMAMNDESEWLQTIYRNGQREVKKIQLRDIALAMSVVLTEQKPSDYGLDFSSTTGTAAPTGNMKYQHLYYRFPDDDARQAGFKKWQEWQAAQKQKK